MSDPSQLPPTGPYQQPGYGYPQQAYAMGYAAQSAGPSGRATGIVCLVLALTILAASGLLFASFQTSMVEILDEATASDPALASQMQQSNLSVEALTSIYATCCSLLPAGVGLGLLLSMPFVLSARKGFTITAIVFAFCGLLYALVGLAIGLAAINTAPTIGIMTVALWGLAAILVIVFLVLAFRLLGRIGNPEYGHTAEAYAQQAVWQSYYYQQQIAQQQQPYQAQPSVQQQPPQQQPPGDSST